MFYISLSRKGSVGNVILVTFVEVMNTFQQVGWLICQAKHTRPAQLLALKADLLGCKASC